MKKHLQIFLFSFATLFSTALSAQNIPNSDFEDWETFLGAQQPKGWFTSALSDPRSIVKSGDAYHGSSALRLETTQIIDGDDTAVSPSYAFTGKLDIMNQELQLGFPYDKRPAKIGFYYKYAPVFEDSMAVSFILRNSKSTSQDEAVGVGTFTSSQQVGAYTYATAEIEYFNNETPDTAAIFISSGFDTVNAGSVLFIDYMNIELTSGINKLASAPNNALIVSSVYPQPANEKVNFALLVNKKQDVKIEITDMLGKTISVANEQAIAGENNFTVPVAGWKQGLYVYRITAGMQSRTGKFMVR